MKRLRYSHFTLFYALLIVLFVSSCSKPDCVDSITGNYRASHLFIYTNDYGNMDTTYSEFNENLDLAVKRTKKGVKILFKGEETEFPITNCSGSYSWEHGGTQDYSTIEVNFTSGALQHESTYFGDQGGYTVKTVHFFTKL
ncbi:MAG: hypothetical protein AB8B56_20970 [Crocinitomicaceae bacterium]